MTKNNNNGNHVNLWKAITKIETDVAWIKKGIWAIGIPVSLMFLKVLFDALPVMAR